MNAHPSWLPPIINVDGNPVLIFQKLYQFFESDFKERIPCFQGRDVWFDRKVEPGDQYEEGFWHLITRKDYATGDRLLDNRRAERLPWCAPSINHSEEPLIKIWDYEEGNGKIRTYLWLESYDYLIILEKRKVRDFEIAFLITAFYIDGDSKRRNLAKKFENKCS